MTITPVQGPLPGRLGVAQPGDRELRPLRAHVLTPGWPALHDRQIPGRHIALQLDLAPGMFRDALLAPAPDPRHIQLRQTCLRHPRQSASGTPRTTGPAASGAGSAAFPAAGPQADLRSR